MQISKQTQDSQKVNTLSWLAIYQVLLCVALLLVWFSQRSISFYWQQTYHQESPLESLERYQWWRVGGELQQKFNQEYEELIVWFDSIQEDFRKNLNSLVLTKHSDNLLDNKTPVEKWKSSPISSQPVKVAVKLPPQEPIKEPELKVFSRSINLINTYSDHTLHQLSFVHIKNMNQYRQVLITKFLNRKEEREENAPARDLTIIGEKKTEIVPTKNTSQIGVIPVAINTSNEQQVITHSHKVTFVELHTGNKVLFAGDSLMQGIAPQIQKVLKKKFGINSINLSKQSTGLSYPHFFDWPATIETTLAKDAQIKLLIVMLGANDPWNMPNPAKKHGAYLKFKSTEWENVYRQRIQRIIDTAKQHQVQLIWIGVPFMRKNQLNQQTRYLNQLYAKEMQQYGIWLPLEQYLSGGKDHFTDTITLNQKPVRVRSKDGIHFTLAGGRYLAEYILQYIHYLPASGGNNENYATK